MEDVSVGNDVSTVIQCVEDLIDFLGQAYANVRTSSAVSEQVSEDLREGIRFLQQLPIVETGQDADRTDKGASAGPAARLLRSAQSSLDALLSDAQATRTRSLGKKVSVGSSHASPLPASSAAQPRVAPGLPGKGVHAAGPGPPHALPLAAQRPAGQAGQRAPVSGPAAPGGPRPGRPLPVAPAGAKTLPKGGPVGSGAAPPEPPRSGGLRSNRNSVELSSSEKGPGKRSVERLTPGDLYVARGGAEQGGAVVQQTSVFEKEGAGGASSGVRFPAIEALRLPTSFRRALSRFHTRVAEKGGEGAFGDVSRAGASIEIDAPSPGLPLVEPLTATSYASQPRRTGTVSADGSAGERARFRFLKRLEQGTDAEGRPNVSTATLLEAADFSPVGLASKAVQNSETEDAVFTLLRAQLALLTSFEGKEIWQAVAPGSSHVARHRNRCLRALLSGLETPNATDPCTNVPQKRVPFTSARNNTIQTGLEPASESRYVLGEMHEACAPSNVHLWLPPICWTAVEISPENLRQSAAEVDVVPATGGKIRAITCSSAKHMSALAHLSHSIECTVLRCYLEAVLVAPLVQTSSDQLEVTNSFLARCRLAYTLLCTEGRGALAISHRDWQ
ncbi:hypothetical protein KFL_002220220 [Klebsormidium nitens]|uniref:Uncharacterized protein n=1 Tax=Klebsormidium nitens TaxID=105231 RepID=A0A1Y1IAP8_KLENI|nr:hypothetical protein KFL_002220220 [Klebsormidium nitens]|eukprot:GAQ85178.1 hypothetical protein KFL_002220220 [Klebsormidium nitens]